MKSRIVSRSRAFAIGGMMLPIAFSVLIPGCIERREFSRPEEADAVVRVEGRVLLKKEFELMLPEEHGKMLTAEEKKNYLDRWITTELLYREALSRGLGSSPEIEARLNQYKKELIADRLIQKVVEERAVVTEKEIRAYYDAHEREYTNEFRVSHIVVGSPEDAETVKKKLERSGFYWVAKKYSIDQRSARKGGDLGFLSKGNMLPEFENIVFKMEVGEVSDIIETEFGYHILKLTEVRPSRHKLRFEDVRDEIANMLIMEKRKAVYDSLVAVVREGKEVEILDSELYTAGIVYDSTGVDTSLPAVLEEEQ